MARFVLFCVIISILILQCHANTLRFKPFNILNQRMDEVDEFLSLFFGSKRGTSLSKAKVSTCGGKAVVIGDYSISPDPITLPGDITLRLKTQLMEDITASDPVKVTQDWKFKPTGGEWITFPCVDNLGACNYTNVCDIINFDPCPYVLQPYHFSCSCPFKKGQYNLDPALTIPIDAEALVPATYSIQANFTRKSTGNLLTCLNLSFVVA